MITDEMRAKWRQRTAFCVKHQDKLSEWALGFIDNIDVILNDEKDLSFKQSSKLNEIFHETEELVG